MSFTLALDCSDADLCLALIRDGGIVKSLSQTPETKHSLDLLRSIRDFLSSANVGLPEIDGVFYGNGPGSFTSLRIGLATLQGLFAGREAEFRFRTCSSLLLRCLSARRGGEAVEILIPAGRGRFYRGRLEKNAFSETLSDADAKDGTPGILLRPEAFLTALSREDWHSNVPLNAVPLNYSQAPNIG